MVVVTKQPDCFAGRGREAREGLSYPVPIA